MELKIIVAVAVLALIGYLLQRSRHSSRLAYIAEYRFHPMLSKKVKMAYPHLSDRDVRLVFDALRDYFHICAQAKNRMVAMPSQVVDVAWHEFILSTRSYEAFSKKAIGRFLHHTPTEVMKTPTIAQEGIKRVWRLACAKEGISPSRPDRLPLLFAIDGLLNIADGYRYSLDCKSGNGVGYCAGDIGCSSGCTGDSGSESISGSSCGASSCGSGCGGGD